MERERLKGERGMERERLKEERRMERERLKEERGGGSTYIVWKHANRCVQ